MEKYKRLSIGLVLALLMLGVAFGAVLFRLDITNKMRLELTAGLVLKDSLGSVIATYDWGTFTDNQGKKMCASGTVYLWNTGNGIANVTWNGNVPLEWRMKIDYYGVEWVKETYKTIPIGGSLAMEIGLIELTAQGGIDYTFTLSFIQAG